LQVEKIINFYKEDPKILEEFKEQIIRKKEHWHWSGGSFRKIIEGFKDKVGIENIDDQIKNHKIDLLNNFNKNAHIDFYLNEDFLENGISNNFQYKDPCQISFAALLGYIGLIRITIEDIIELIEENKGIISYNTRNDN